MSCTFSRTHFEGASEVGAVFDGRFVQKFRNSRKVARGVDLGSEISDGLTLKPPQVPNQKSDWDG